MPTNNPQPRTEPFDPITRTTTTRRTVYPLSEFRTSTFRSTGVMHNEVGRITEIRFEYLR